MGLRIESIQSDARILIAETKNHNNSYSFSGYSETWKKIWECIRPILITLSCGAWKPDPFIQVSCQGKTVYILPDQIKESYKKLHVALPSTPITEETLARWVLSVGFVLPVSTTPNEQPSTLSSTSSASDSTSTQQPSQEPSTTEPPLPAPSDSTTSKGTSTQQPPQELQSISPEPKTAFSSSLSSVSSSPSSNSSEMASALTSVVSSNLKSSQSVVAQPTSSIIQPKALAESVLFDKNLNDYAGDDYHRFYAFHLNEPFQSYRFMEKVNFIYALLSSKFRVQIKRLLSEEACAHIVTKIIETTNDNELDLDKSDLTELKRYTKPGVHIIGHVRAAAFRILSKKDPSMTDAVAVWACFAADQWCPN